MNRRSFLQGLGVTTAGVKTLHDPAHIARSLPPEELLEGLGLSAVPDIQGHTLLAEFPFAGADWKVYENLRTRDGVITFVSSLGQVLTLPKSAEATFAEATPPYLGLSLDDIGLDGRDLLAEKLLEGGGGDPDPERVKAAAPPLGSAHDDSERWGRLPWNTFVGTRECFDTMPVFPSGSTRTYHPVQYFPELTSKAAEKRLEGLVGGWLPAVRKVFPGSGTGYYEAVVFGDVEAPDKFIVQTWHRTAHVEEGKITKVVYGYSYPDFPPRRRAPSAAEFYRALLVFAAYWEKELADMAEIALPRGEWVHMTKHAVAREVMVRPGGVYPKYGAVDRDYYGPEYDGFQDIFTMSLYTNLELGRLESAKVILDNYISDFVDETGMVNMRGPETAQFGMTLSLLARYFNYTKDSATLLKHKKKILATVELLSELHDIALKLPPDDPGSGLIHGWSESDSCLMPKPMMWWLPYYANSAFAARGFRDLAKVWQQIDPSDDAKGRAASWASRSDTLTETVVEVLRKNVRQEMKPPYIGTYPGAKLTFRDSMAKEHPSPQGWPHRPYAELLQADVLPGDLANVVINCMQSYGATTLGVVANVGPARPKERAILGFISYGYAQMLLRLERIEEYLLFLYSHRYHDHTRGSWTAGEVSGIDGDTAIFCIPAQQTIPLLIRWMLVLEDSDKPILYLAKGVPRDWLASGEEIRIERAPTRWGTVTIRMKMDTEKSRIAAHVQLTGSVAPEEVHVKLRLPKTNRLKRVTVNGKEGELAANRETVVIRTGSERSFDVTGEVG